MGELLLKVRDLETHFKTPEGTVHAVNGVSFHIKEGETLGVVGESGCGKSVTMLSCLRLIPSPPGKIVAGEALFRGSDLLKMDAEDIRHVRGGQISMVFQQISKITGIKNRRIVSAAPFIIFPGTFTAQIHFDIAPEAKIMKNHGYGFFHGSNVLLNKSFIL